jgi:hypothetical protein
VRAGRALVAAVALLGALRLARRRQAKERVAVHLQDGSIRMVAGGSPGGERLLVLAREALEVARS